MFAIGWRDFKSVSELGANINSHIQPFYSCQIRLRNKHKIFRVKYPSPSTVKVIHYEDVETQHLYEGGGAGKLLARFITKQPLLTKTKKGSSFTSKKCLILR